MWGGLPKKDAKMIQVIMNKCARMILGKSRHTRTRTLMTNCGWLYFQELVLFHLVVQLYKIVHLGTPVNLRRMLTVENDLKLTTTPGRLKIVRDSFRWRTICAWNELPSHLLHTPKLTLFKKHLKQYIIDNRADVTVRRPPDVD